MKFILLAGVVLLAGPCSSDTTVSNENVDEATIANTETKVEKKKPASREKSNRGFSGLKLHPEKQFCVTYQHKGMGMSGTSEMCSRKYGQESYTIENMTMGMAGFTQSHNKHTIIIKDKVYTTKLGSGKWTVATNPMYEGLTKANPEDLSKQMMAAIGMSKTGETETIAGTKCNTYNSTQMGEACFTKKMVMLRQSIMGMEQVATRVHIGNAGDASKYAKPKNAKQAPDVGSIMEMMGKRQ